MPFSGGSLPKRSNEWKAMSNEYMKVGKTKIYYG